MKKKLLALLLTLVLTLSCLTACSSDKSSTENNADNGTSASSESDTAEGNKEDKAQAEEEKDASSDKKAEDASEKTDTDSVSKDAEEATSAEIAESQPFFSNFTSVTVDGEDVNQDILKGNKLTMVNVWGTFCAPCIREMPDLQKISESYEDKGVKLIGMVIDTYDYSKGENNKDKVAKAEEIMSQTGVKYTNILPSESLNNAKLDYIFTVPTTYFLDENGVMVGTVFEGSRSYEQWSSIIDELLANM